MSQTYQESPAADKRSERRHVLHGLLVPSRETENAAGNETERADHEQAAGRDEARAAHNLRQPGQKTDLAEVVRRQLAPRGLPHPRFFSPFRRRHRPVK